MANRIRGKKRQEIIDKWLKGVEDPDVEVKPTKKDNRYIVRPKQTLCLDKAKESVTESTAKVSPVKEEHVKVSPVKEERVKYKPVKEEPQSEYEYEYEYEEEEPSRVRNAELVQYQYEILNELRRMNEERASRREEKERKKELKHQIQHQLYRQSMKTESLSRQPQNDEVRPIQRRRLNLLGRF